MRQSLLDYCNDGPWKVIPTGVCGDIMHEGEFFGSMRLLNACEVVKQLNQRHRWLKQQH